MRKIKKGFTLLEIVVVCLVLAVIFAITMVNYRDFISKQNVKASVDEIAMDLRLAQANAIRSEQYYTAYFRMFHSPGMRFGDIYTDTITIRSNTDSDGGAGNSKLIKVHRFKETIRVNFPGGKDKIILCPNGTIDFAFNGKQNYIAEKRGKNSLLGIAYAKGETPSKIASNSPAYVAGWPHFPINIVPQPGKPPAEKPAPLPPLNETVTLTITIGKYAAYIDIQRGGKISVRY